MTSAPSANEGSLWLEGHLRQSAVASNTEYCRLHRSSIDDVATAKRLRETAEQLEQRSKRSRIDALDALRLTKSFEFEVLCLALRRNDPETTSVECSSVGFPKGYGELLGPALYQNTHVSSIWLCLEQLMPDKEDGYSAAQVGRVLGSLLEFVATSESMRRVAVSKPHADNSLSEILICEIFKVLFTNRGNIEELTLAVSKIPADVFQLYMMSAKLHKLDINFHGSHSYDSNERQLIEDAFQHNTLLRSLCFKTIDSRLALSVLTGLSNRGNTCKLRDLKVVCIDHSQSYFSVLSRILSTQGPLDHLHLDGAQFEPADMAHFIDGLRGGSNPTSMTSVSKLTLDECVWSAGSVRLLVDFMHTKVDLPTASPVGTSLRELVFPYDETWCGSDLVSLLSLQPSQDNQGPADGTAIKWHATIGSQLQSLSVSYLQYCFDGFLDSLAEHADQIQLQRLHVGGALRRPESKGLAQCISKVSSLRELVVDEPIYRYCAPIIASLKQNGNIQRVTFPKTNGKWKLAYVYAERNQHLQPLLSTVLESNAANQGRGTESISKDIRLCPSLLEVSTQILNTKSSTLSRALVLLRDSIGPCGM